MDIERVELPATVGAMASLGAVLLLIPVRDGIGLVNAVVALTAVVIGAGLLGGSAAGATAGAIAGLGVSAIQVVPYWQLRIDGVEDVLTAVLLVGLGMAAGRAARSGRARRRVWIHHLMD